MPTVGVGSCALCGTSHDGIPFADWVKPTFTDHDKITPGTMVCQACQFCSSEATPGLAERVGKTTAQKFRNYSHLVVDGVWYPLSKGDKPQIRALLFAEPTVALIAYSGQKHLFFRSLPKWWQLEEHAVRPNVTALRQWLDLIEPLYNAGISKAELESGRYEQTRIMQVGVTAWRAAEAELRAVRGTPVFGLALFLAQRTEESHDA
jgi:hypothetical protein